MDTVPAPRVMLISPPWTSLNEPSLGLSILKAVLRKQGIFCRVYHLNLFALEFLRGDTYAAIGQAFALNDFLFSGILDPCPSARQLRLLREKCAELAAVAIDFRRYGGIPGVVSHILRLRNEVIPKWVESEVAYILEARPTLVGFTCMFDQTIASAAISMRLKALSPGITVAFGGYAVRAPTGPMLLQAFPWIDAICTGEGEPCIAELARASAAPIRDLSNVPNLIYRNPAGQVAESRRAPLLDMDRVPVPDFDDFYEDVRRLQREHKVEVSIDRLPVENSRGCWWGASHHCVFCGIHDDDLNYRSRTSESVLSMLAQLSERYGCREYRFSDYILPHAYYVTLLPALVEAGAPYRIKCELKANISEDKASLLAAAGFIEVQPGIESFCTSVLKAMDKGVSGIQNVHLLLMARRFGITIFYNILYGLPQDDAESVEAMVQALPLLKHLDPPSTRGRIQITRYAPLHADPARFNLPQPRHEHSYELIFSDTYRQKSGFDLDQYCYMFEIPFEPSSRLARAYREIERLCDEWTAADNSRTVDLRYDFDDRRRVIIQDSRADPALTYFLDEAAGWLLLECERPSSLARLKERHAQKFSDNVEVSLNTLRKCGLVFEDAGKVVSLALPRDGIAARRHWWDNDATRWQPVWQPVAEARQGELQGAGLLEGS